MPPKASKKETPKKETPKKETPKKETPKKEPKKQPKTEKAKKAPEKEPKEQPKKKKLDKQQIADLNNTINSFAEIQRVVNAFYEAKNFTTELIDKDIDDYLSNKENMQENLQNLCLGLFEFYSIQKASEKNMIGNLIKDIFYIVNKNHLVKEAMNTKFFGELLDMLIAELDKNNTIPFLQEALYLTDFLSVESIDRDKYFKFVDKLLAKFKNLNQNVHDLKSVIDNLILSMNAEKINDYYNKLLQISDCIMLDFQLQFSFYMFNFSANIKETPETKLPIGKIIKEIAERHYTQCYNFPNDARDELHDNIKYDLKQFADIVSKENRNLDTLLIYLDSFLDNFCIELAKDHTKNPSMLFSSTFDKRFLEFNFNLIILLG